MSSSSLDNDFIGAQESRKSGLISLHIGALDRTPEKLLYIGNGELLVTEMRSLFFLSNSPSSSSLLVLWGTWDNSLIVKSTVNESTTLRLHSHPFNKVSWWARVYNSTVANTDDAFSVHHTCTIYTKYNVVDTERVISVRT